MEQKVMSDYSLFCTEEQTKKAFELGAPIIILPNYEEFKNFPFVHCKNGYEYPCQIPTAEQMIGWLETLDKTGEIFLCRVMDEGNPTWSFDIFDHKGFHTGLCKYSFSSRKEATLAAIDAALDYLLKNK